MLSHYLNDLLSLSEATLKMFGRECLNINQERLHYEHGQAGLALDKSDVKEL